jgi:hypothetical protein
MGYMEITTIVEGALEGSLCFGERLDEIVKLNNHIQSTQSFARDNSDMDVQIYKLWHEHDEQNVECDCIQFETDHNPFWQQIGKSSSKEAQA